MHKQGIYEKYFKRLLDFCFAILLLIVVSPIILVLSFLIKLNLGTPIIFKQKRPGLHAKIFTLYKFRSMTDEKDKDGKILPDSKRLTMFGRWLRHTSLDELPELVNIIRGDMSFVGPRPLAVEYLPYYSKEEMHRHDVRPGLTGLAQIHGRNTTKWEIRFSYDIDYVNHVTFLNDARIIFNTVKVVLKGDGIGVRPDDGSTDFHVYRKKQMEDMKNESHGRKDLSASHGT